MFKWVSLEVILKYYTFIILYLGQFGGACGRDNKLHVSYRSPLQILKFMIWNKTHEKINSGFHMDKIILFPCHPAQWAFSYPYEYYGHMYMDYVYGQIMKNQVLQMWLKISCIMEGVVPLSG